MVQHTSVEVKRIISAYERYERDPDVRQRWGKSIPGNERMARERDEILLEMLRRRLTVDLSDVRVLDVGCGYGQTLSLFQQWGARPSNLFGVDLVESRIHSARDCFPSYSFQIVNAEALPFPDGSFDFIVLYTVFSSILDDTMAENVASQVQRVMKPGGSVIWYDFRYDNPFNRNVRGVSAKTVGRLFPTWDRELKLITVVAALPQRMGRTASWLYPLLSRIPLFCTHYAGLITKPQ